MTRKIISIAFLTSFTSIAMAQLPTAISTEITFRTDAILFGDDVLSNDQWPWQVFIELDSGRNQCGGTLISNQWILTAAHCFDGGMQTTKIVMGTVRKSGKHGIIGIADIVCCHEKYNSQTLDFDICLIKLAKPRDPTINLRPVSLPIAQSEVPEGTECYITGWGYNENRILPDILQEATVKVVARQTCIDWHKPHNTVVVNNTICAGHEKGGADSCGGDSGGPMVCFIVGEYHLQGVTSYGPSYCGAAKAPGIYTKVSAYVDWIREKMTNPCPKTEWGSWSEVCSVTCGVGTQSKSRVCFNDVREKVNSSLCKGEPERSGLCIKTPCPKYKWSNWTNGICGKTCGDAIRMDDRYCTADNGTRVDPGRCAGPSTRSVNCTLPDCPVPHFWGPWSSVCSVTCGDGVLTRTRTCMNVHGETTNEISRCFPGNFNEIDTCQLPACSGISWGEWGPWSSCQPSESSTCLGESYSTRSCSLSGLAWFRGFCAGDYQRSRYCLWRTCSPQELELLG